MRFMPGYYVFPGGRVDPADLGSSGFQEPLTPAPEGIDQATRRRLPVFARTALRETYEETGLLLGAEGRSRAGSSEEAAGPTSEVWRAYRSAGVTPGFSGLSLVARAITPTSSPIRFHTRFFCADGDAVRGDPAGDGELEDLRWVPLDSTGELQISGITYLVLNEALAHRKDAPGGSRPAALFCWTGEKRRRK